MRQLTISFFISLVLFISGCNDDNGTHTCCDQLTIVSEAQFNNAPNDTLTIINAVINDDCLEVEFSASGCSGDSWVVKLIDSGAIAESLPVQRTLRLSLQNEEACLAVFTQKISFDLIPIRTNDNSLLINLEGWDDQILYTY